MADLDDFFAKKDRKKSKNVKKYATADEIVKKLEDPGKKPDKPGKKERSNQEGDDTGIENHEQDEWKDFEEEKKDYSGLKIGHLSLNVEGGNSAEARSDAGGQGGGEVTSSSEKNSGGENSQQDCGKSSGPWKMVQSKPQVEQVVEPTPPPEQKSSGPTGYVAPALRGPRPQPTSRLRSKAAPDITNEEFFPTLSGAKPEPSGGVWGRKPRSEGPFEEVRYNKASSARQVAEARGPGGSSSQGPKLILGNRYNTLSNNDS